MSGFAWVTALFEFARGGAGGVARPGSAYPRSFSTLGLLKRLNSDILDDKRGRNSGRPAESFNGVGGTACVCWCETSGRVRRDLPLFKLGGGPSNVWNDRDNSGSLFGPWPA